MTATLDAPAGDTGTAPLGVSVVICAYTMRRWEQLESAVVSVLHQTQPPDEIFVVVDHCPPLLERAPSIDSRIRVHPNVGPKGLSGARNTGVLLASGDVVAFLDDDAVAEPEWLRTLTMHYGVRQVVGVGGRVLPDWDGTQPAWFPAELLWVVGCSYRGQPTETADVRNPIGANMSYRRSAILDAGGFSSHLGRDASTPLGCEETELSIRIARLRPSSRVLLEPRAVVRHHVPVERASWRYLRRRCWAEGISKARVRQLSDARLALASERTYVTHTLPAGVAHAAYKLVVAQEAAALGRAVAIVTGLCITSVGYVVGLITSHLPRRGTREESGNLA